MKSRYGLLSSLTAILLFIALESVSVLMVTEKGIVQRFKVLGTVRGLQAWGWNSSRKVAGYFNYKAENERLASENLQLRQQLARYEAASQELDSIATIVEPAFTYIGATVIKNSVDKQHNYLIVNRGEQDGVEAGMGVVTARGVIGIVGAVSRRYAYVYSLLNTDQSVSAKLAGNGAFGPMSWQGRRPDRVLLQEIPVHVAVSPGDTVLSSGFSTLYPPDIPIGCVVSAQVGKGSAQELTVQLFEDFRSLQNVYIVKNNRRQELEELYEKAR